MSRMLRRDGRAVLIGGRAAREGCALDCCDGDICGSLCEIAGGAACLADPSVAPSDIFMSVDANATGIISDCSVSAYDTWAMVGSGSASDFQGDISQRCVDQIIQRQGLVLHTANGGAFCQCGCADDRGTFETTQRFAGDYNLQNRIVPFDPDDPLRNDGFYGVPFGEVNELIPGAYEVEMTTLLFGGVQRQECGPCPGRRPAVSGEVSFRCIHQPGGRFAGAAYFIPDAIQDDFEDNLVTAVSAEVTLAIRGVVAGIQLTASITASGERGPSTGTFNGQCQSAGDILFIHPCCDGGSATTTMTLEGGKPMPTALNGLRERGLV